MPRVDCPDCQRSIAIHQLETRTVAQTTGFETTYCCPFCRTEFDDVTGLL